MAASCYVKAQIIPFTSTERNRKPRQFLATEKSTITLPAKFVAIWKFLHLKLCQRGASKPRFLEFEIVQDGELPLFYKRDSS
jgi:hypothetical protein